MNTYTVIAYVLPAGAHHVETLDANDPTDAAIRIRETLLLTKSDFEIVAVIRGTVHFELVVASAVALAPYCSPRA